MFRRVKQWSAGAVGVMTLTLGLSGAFAQAQSADGMTSFESFLRAGTEAQKNGEYEKAIEHFQKAAAIVDHPRLQMEIGSAYQELGECKKSRSTYEALRGRTDLEKPYIDGIKERLAGLESCVEYGQLSVECSVSDVELEVAAVVDGAKPASDEKHVSGTCPGNWRLPEGEYTLTARADGMAEEQMKVRVVGGQTAQEYVKFQEPMSIATPEKSGGFSQWGVYAGAGAAGIGAVLTTIAVISDSGSGERLQELQRIEHSGDTKLFKDRSAENDSIRSRNIGLYAGGAALLLGGGGVLVWSLLSPDTDKAASASASGLENRGVSVQLALQPREIGFRVRW